MSNELTLIAAITDWEKEDFLPDTLWSELNKSFKSVMQIDPLSLDIEAWESLLQTNCPDVLVTGWKTPTLPISLIDRIDQPLSYVCHLAGTVRKLVPRELVETGLTITNWGNSISPTVAECALLLTLTSLRRAGYWNIAMHQGENWKNAETVTASLFNRRVGIHGFGSISRCLIPLLKPFNVTISTYSPSVNDTSLNAFGVQRAETLEALFSENDVIIELAPYKPENHHIVTEELLNSIPDGGAFINVGRGAVVDEQALIKIAETGRIQVALDVYQVEPLPMESRLRTLENVTLLPHLGGPTKDHRKVAGAFALENLKRFLNKQPLDSLIDLSVYDRAT